MGQQRITPLEPLGVRRVIPRRRPGRWPDDLLAAYARASAVRGATKELTRKERIIRDFLRVGRISQAADITASVVQDYIAELVARGRAPRTVRCYHSAVRLFCRLLLDRGLIYGDPCAYTPLPAIEETAPRYLTEAEIGRLLPIARQAGIEIEVLVAINTGLRMSELRHLRWDAPVDLAGRTLIVRRAKGRRPRAIPLNGAALAALTVQRERYGHLSFVFPGGRGGHHHGQVWDQDRPRSLTWWDRMALPPIQERVPKFREARPGTVGSGWHLFRSTFASRLVQAGVSIFKVSVWLGHKSPATTAAAYAILAPGYDPDIERL